MILGLKSNVMQSKERILSATRATQKVTGTVGEFQREKEQSKQMERDVTT